MKKQIRILSMVLCLIMAFAMLSSCSLYDKESDKTGSDTASSEKAEPSFKDKYTEEELNTPVITIGKRTVTMSEYIDFFQEIYNYYNSSYGVDITETNETLTKYLDLITETLTKDTMVLHKADELGLTDFTDEQLKEIEDKFEQEKTDMVEYYTDYINNQLTESDDTDIEAEIEKHILEEAEYYCGKGTTKEQYYEYLHKQTIENYIKDLLFAEVTKDIKVDEKDIKEWYESYAEKDETYFKGHPEGYKDEWDSYQTTGYISDGKTAVTPLYVPEGYSRIYDICIATKTSTSDVYKDNAKQMATISTEYGKLAFENATTGETKANKDRMAEILKEYNKLKAENEKELVELNKDAKKEIEKAYKELQSGKDFAEVMQKYTQDDDYKAEGAYAEKGRLISTRYKSTTDWSDEVKSAFSKTGAGKYSEVFIDASGYHIIFNIGKEKAGVRTLSESKKQIEENLIGTEKQEAYDKMLDEWCKDGKGVVRNYELIETLCK